MAHHTVVQRVGRRGAGAGAQRTSRSCGRPPAYPPTRRHHRCTGCAVRSARSCRSASADGSCASSSPVTVYKRGCVTLCDLVCSGSVGNRTGQCTQKPICNVPCRAAGAKGTGRSSSRLHHPPEPKASVGSREVPLMSRAHIPLVSRTQASGSMCMHMHMLCVPCPQSSVRCLCWTRAAPAGYHPRRSGAASAGRSEAATAAAAAAAKQVDTGSNGRCPCPRCPCARPSSCP